MYLKFGAGNIMSILGVGSEKVNQRKMDNRIINKINLSYESKQDLGHDFQSHSQLSNNHRCENFRPGGECRNVSPTGKFIGASELSQF